MQAPEAAASLRSTMHDGRTLVPPVEPASGDPARFGLRSWGGPTGDLPDHQ